MESVASRVSGFPHGSMALTVSIAYGASIGEAVTYAVSCRPPAQAALLALVHSPPHTSGLTAQHGIEMASPLRRVEVLAPAVSQVPPAPPT